VAPQLSVGWKCFGGKVERIVERAVFGTVAAVIMVNETHSSQIQTHLLHHFIFEFVDFLWRYPASGG
jgi:hypothetical protein